MTLYDDIERFVRYKQGLGLKYLKEAKLLRAFGNWADERGERYILQSSVIGWAKQRPSLRRQRYLLLLVRRFALWLHAEDSRHEIPHLDAVGRQVNRKRRPTPHLLKDDEIRLVMDAALVMPRVKRLNRLTYHTSIGLIATTGLRVGEASSLKVPDLTEDGLVIRAGKFGKSRLVALHPTTHEALDRYLSERNRYVFDNDNLFVLADGRALHPKLLGGTFLSLARKLGLRGPKGTPGTRLYDLRHAFATRSLAQAITTDRDRISRHMLALSTYMGHAEVASTYWYLEATPVLLEQVATVTENTFDQSGRVQ